MSLVTKASGNETPLLILPIIIDKLQLADSNLLKHGQFREDNLYLIVGDLDGRNHSYYNSLIILIL